MSARTKILLVLLVLALVLGGFWLAKRPEKETYYVGLSQEQVVKAKALLEEDGDKDGLKDWEEQLWKTDPHNPDTDGDGTPDGEEIRLGRNPLIANTAAAGTPPSDLLDKETIETKTTLGQAPWTETDQLSREFFARYLAIKKSGQTITPEIEAQLIGEVISHYPPTLQKKTFGEGDLALASADDAAAYRSYGNALGAALAKRREASGENELVIYERALTDEDAGDLATLQSRAARYEGFITDIKAIPTPKGAVAAQLVLLNAFEGLKESVEGMSLAMKDPVASLGPTGAYPNAVQALTDAMTAVSGLFTEKQVVFGKSEGGYIFTGR